MSLFDENAEILEGMEEDGSDLSPSRRVDFSHVFPSRASAESFAADAKEVGFDAAVEEVDRDDDRWDVTASKEMVPSAENVTLAEERLGELARGREGRSDGWGFMRV
jgi:regulator of RNase E activity RraB